MNMRWHYIISLWVMTLFSQHKDAALLVSVGDINSHIKIECMYATYHNFTGQIVYPKKYYSCCYLRKEVAHQLSKVQEELEKEGLGLLVWDAYRPMSAQKKFWDLVPDERYVSPPTNGGRHTRGTTVDVTLIDMATGEPLDMGTGFDVFIDRAHTDNEQISSKAKNNRKKLKDAMMKYGFESLQTEWWHYDYTGWQNYPVLQVDFE